MIPPPKCAQKLFLMVTIEVEKLPLLARDPPCTCPTLVTWIIERNVYGCHHSIPNWSRNSLVSNNVGCNSQNWDNMPRKSNMGFFCWVVYIIFAQPVSNSCWTCIQTYNINKMALCMYTYLFVLCEWGLLVFWMMCISVGGMYVFGGVLWWLYMWEF